VHVHTVACKYERGRRAERFERAKRKKVDGGERSVEAEKKEEDGSCEWKE